MTIPHDIKNITPPTRYVCYYRVSTQRQGESGLGLEAQRAAVLPFIGQRGGIILDEVTETESGKKVTNRPQLQHALALCRKNKTTLCIAKLDRLARNVTFVAGVLETNVEFVAADLPTKDRFMLHLQAAFAEEEARRISVRTREALAAAKRRGVVIGASGRVLAKRYHEAAVEDAQHYWPVVRKLEEDGITTMRGMRDELNKRGVPSPGGAKWHLPSVSKLISRLRVRVLVRHDRPAFEHAEV